MSKLDVLLNGELVAELDDAAGAGLASLQYTDECRATHQPGSPLLSLRLPVRPEMYSGMDTKAWLDGLMPEGDARDILASRAKLDRTDLVGFLRVYGRDCAGAVSIVDSAGPADPPPSVDWLSAEQLEQKIRDLPRAPFGLPSSGKVRVSLGGIQGKLAVVVDEDKIGLPEGLQASTHILKPNPTTANGAERYPGIVTAEALCMHLFDYLGLDTAKADILDLATGPALLVTRYDREHDNGKVRRRHQEDLCQAMGVASAMKYQSRSVPGSPTLRALVEQLNSYQSATVAAMRELLGRVYANALVTNCDAHGKNWSLMLPGNGVSLAPVYDVVPSTLWPEVNTDLAMFIGECAVEDELTVAHIIAEAGGWGMGRRAANAVIGTLHAKLPRALELACKDVVKLGGDSTVIDRVSDIITKKAVLLAP